MTFCEPATRHMYDEFNAPNASNASAAWMSWDRDFDNDRRKTVQLTAYSDGRPSWVWCWTLEGTGKDRKRVDGEGPQRFDNTDPAVRAALWAWLNSASREPFRLAP